MSAAGWYWDTVTDETGVAWRSPRWRKNLIVASAWPLVAALLRNEPGTRGILYCAVGEGDPSWDTGPPAPAPDATRLRQETARVAVPPSAIGYRDAAGGAVATPTHRLGLSVVLGPAQTARRLREFGLVGGDAVATPGSGRLINYAVHPLIELRPGQTLTRTIRLSFRPGSGAGGGDTGDLPLHWLGGEPVVAVDGVGAAVAESLQASRVTTVGQLALLDPTRPPKGLSSSRAVELRAKARLALQTAAQLVSLPALDGRTVDEVLDGEGEGSAPADALDRLRGQLGLLQVALDARRLRRLTLAQLRRRPS